MTQSARDARLETRTARLRLPIQQRHFKAIGDGLTLVYRRTSDGFGTWSTKLALPSGKYALRALGTADDYQDANGADVLNFRQAQEKARGLAEVAKANAGIVITPLSVGEAAERYLAWYRDHRRAYRETEHATRAHILPALGATRLDELTSAQIRGWLERLAAKPARVRASAFVTGPKYRAAPKTADEKRARRATANRVFNILKAILNRAFENGLVGDDLAWRKVRPLPKADEARIRFLSDSEAVRLVNACRRDLRPLVQAALLTGARNGELVAMTVRDVNLVTAQIYIAQSKSGHPRFVPLNPEGVTLFRSLVTGKAGDQLLFMKSDGKPWGKNHHVRPVIEACKTAKVQPPISFHELRHTYASHLAQAGVDILTISKLLGHADTRVTSRHYAHLADKTLAQAVTKLPSFGGILAEKVSAIR
jgi:integrase